MAGVSTLHTPAPAGPGLGAWVVYARPLLKGQVTWTGEPSWALSRGAAPALCFLEQAAEGRGPMAQKPAGKLEKRSGEGEAKLPWCTAPNSLSDAVLQCILARPE